MTITRTCRSVALATAAAASLFAATTPAGATTPATAPTAAATKGLAAIQAAGAAATANRTRALDAAIPRVTANTALSASDRTTVLATLTNDLAAMNTLAAKIAADTTVEAAEADYKSIFSTYRVFAVALPQSAYAAAADDLTDTTLPKLVNAQKALAALLAGPDSGKDAPPVQADLADMSAKITSAQTLIAPVAAAALAVTPADYDANHAVLTPLRQSVANALAAAKAASADAAAIVAALQ